MERLTDEWSDEKMVARFGSRAAQRAIFMAMAAAFQPAMAAGFSGDLAFDLLSGIDDDGTTDTWTVAVRDGKARARPGRPEAPAMTLRIGLADFVRLASGEVGPVRLLVDGKAQVDGDILLGGRLGEMFGAVKPFEIPFESDE